MGGSFQLLEKRGVQESVVSYIYSAVSFPSYELSESSSPVNAAYLHDRTERGGGGGGTSIDKLRENRK